MSLCDRKGLGPGESSTLFLANLRPGDWKLQITQKGRQNEARGQKSPGLGLYMLIYPGNPPKGMLDRAFLLDFSRRMGGVSPLPPCS